ncbi:MAG: hypothetical protein KDN20_11725 [Verrucomicrobiae bacterium]|nr:hypothetical protein [Verrucomicrobiae bacterium]
MEFISEHSIFSREAREEREDNIGSLFLWSVAIVVLLGLNAFSWVFCMYVFGNPEVPFCYKLLTKLEKLDPIESFDPVSAPRGKFHGAKSLYLEYFDLGSDKLNAYNGALKRFYLKNYLERDDVTYISGTFTVESSRELRTEDVFPHGVAVRLKAEDFPAAHLDLVLPSPEDAVIPKEHFRPGDIVQIPESAFCAAVLHVQRLDNDQICFTAVPLVKRDDEKREDGSVTNTRYQTPAETLLTIIPPEKLNLETGKWPISDGSGLVASPIEKDEAADADSESTPAPTDEVEKADTDKEKKKADN